MTEIKRIPRQMQLVILSKGEDTKNKLINELRDNHLKIMRTYDDRLMVKFETTYGNIIINILITRDFTVDKNKNNYLVTYGDGIFFMISNDKILEFELMNKDISMIIYSHGYDLPNYMGIYNYAGYIPHNEEEPIGQILVLMRNYTNNYKLFLI